MMELPEDAMGQSATAHTITNTATDMILRTYDGFTH